MPDSPIALIALVAVAVLVVAFVMFVTRSERRLVSGLHARMTQRGFAREPSVPPAPTTDLGLEPRFGWRGKLAGEPVAMAVGRGFGQRLSPAAKFTSTGHFFYVWALVPPSAARDETWLARWKGDARAVRQPDGGAFVYWQRDYTAENVGAALDELDASLLTKA